ncbi:MAG: hypothetical protein IPO92_21895 [Saprospiraceae bacterium]|nr:hypothetical protein [Saprospiraceae bacterium]
MQYKVVYELTARFNEAATYYLTYGNNRATKPQFDIDHFVDKIPAILTTLKLGDELLIKRSDTRDQNHYLKQSMVMGGHDDCYYAAWLVFTENDKTAITIWL